MNPTSPRKPSLKAPQKSVQAPEPPTAAPVVVDLATAAAPEAEDPVVELRSPAEEMVGLAKTIVAELEARGVEPEDLDELIHDIADEMDGKGVDPDRPEDGSLADWADEDGHSVYWSKRASEANNHGLQAQVEFFCEYNWEDLPRAEQLRDCLNEHLPEGKKLVAPEVAVALWLPELPTDGIHKTCCQNCQDAGDDDAEVDLLPEDGVFKGTCECGCEATFGCPPDVEQFEDLTPDLQEGWIQKAVVGCQDAPTSHRERLRMGQDLYIQAIYDAAVTAQAKAALAGARQEGLDPALVGSHPATMKAELTKQILQIPSGEKRVFPVAGKQDAFVVYFDSKPAIGDRGQRVPTMIAGDFEVWRTPTPEDLHSYDLVLRQHVSPGAPGGAQMPYAAQRCADAIIRSVRA